MFSSILHHPRSLILLLYPYMPHDLDGRNIGIRDDPDDLALPRRKVAPIDRWLDAPFRFAASFLARSRPVSSRARRSASYDGGAPDHADDLAPPRRTTAPIDARLDRAFRSTLLMGVATVYGVGMWLALNAVARPHDQGWEYTAFALAVGAVSVAGAVWTGAAVRRKPDRG